MRYRLNGIFDPGDRLAVADAGKALFGECASEANAELPTLIHEDEISTGYIVPFGHGLSPLPQVRISANF